MARKFKIGDVVRVARIRGPVAASRYVKVGHRGTVTNYNVGDVYNYSVTRKNGEHDAFMTRELELVNRKGN